MNKTMEFISENHKRVLVWGLSNNLAGTEGVIRNIVKVCYDEVAFDFLTTEDVPNHRDIINLGNNRLFVLPKITNFSNVFRKALKEHFSLHASEYNAVWSNLCDARNIEVLKLAYKHDIPRRILHSHNSDMQGPLNAKLLSNLRKKQIQPKLTDRWACSEKAGRYMFGRYDFDIIPNAIPFSQYRFNEVLRNETRASMSIPENAFVIGCIGRLVKTKNHEFVLNLMVSMQELGKAHFVIVGDGVMKNDLVLLAKKLNLESRVHFINSSKSTQALYSSFDVFAFPSLFEGLPLVLLEAQANGLPIVMSSNISEEGIISNSVFRVPLENQAKWAESLVLCDRANFKLTEKAQKYDLDCQADLFKRSFLEQ